MKRSFEEALTGAWRQALVENAKFVGLGYESYPVRRTPKRGLSQVDFVFEGNEIRGLEQNPDTKSRWAQMARAGKKVMQLLSGGRYVANAVDGKAPLLRARRDNYADVVIIAPSYGIHTGHPIGAIRINDGSALDPLDNKIGRKRAYRA